jgi:MGT family glycosyltransferase
MNALGNLDMQVIMTIGEEIEIESLPTPPKNFMIEQYIPNTYLLPKISCMVHHGRFNSTIAPIVYGVPVVVIPFEGDQLENAQRCVEAGIGLRLNYEKLTPNKLRQTILHILHEQKFKKNVLKLKDKFAQYNAPKTSADLLIKFASK